MKIPNSNRYHHDIYSLFKAYEEGDPPVKQQASLPLSVFNKMLQNASNPLQRAIAELAYGALFFAMRSCEYSKTNEKNPKTHILCLKDISFYDCKGHPVTKHLHKAHAVKITFPNQKNGEKDESIIRYAHRSKTGPDPVAIWAAIVTRIQSYEGTNEDTPINTVCVRHRLFKITNVQIRKYVKFTVRRMGFRRLGLHPSDVGTHSIRTSFATLLASQNVNVSYIMLQGRWKSNCVMNYIRKEIVDNDTSEHILAITNLNKRKLA